jgi:hypothetical protein
LKRLDAGQHWDMLDDGLTRKLSIVGTIP